MDKRRQMISDTYESHEQGSVFILFEHWGSQDDTMLGVFYSLKLAQDYQIQLDTSDSSFTSHTIERWMMNKTEYIEFWHKQSDQNEWTHHS
jgi:hypothetical protein